MWKKILSIISVVILMVNVITIVHADDEIEELLRENELQESIGVFSDSVDEPVINSKIALIYDRKSGRVLFRKE